jgi:hypothetical protein
MCTNCPGSTGSLQNQHFVDALSILSTRVHAHDAIVAERGVGDAGRDLARVDVHYTSTYSVARRRRYGTLGGRV